MDAQHTPGRYRVIKLTGSYGIYCENGNRIGTATREPDARLITAAPDLLAALEELVRVVGVRIDDPRVRAFDAAFAAIAKAKGQS